MLNNQMVELSLFPNRFFAEFVSSKNFLHLQMSFESWISCCHRLHMIALSLKGVYLNGTTVKGILAMLVVR